MQDRRVHGVQESQSAGHVTDEPPCLVLVHLANHSADVSFFTERKYQIRTIVADVKIERPQEVLVAGIDHQAELMRQHFVSVLVAAC